jgi:hypothetical protein
MIRAIRFLCCAAIACPVAAPAWSGQPGRPPSAAAVVTPVSAPTTGRESLTDAQRGPYRALLTTPLADVSGAVTFDKAYTGANAGLPQVYVSFTTIHGAGGQVVFTFSNPDAIAGYFAGGNTSPYLVDAASKMAGGVTLRDEKDTTRDITWHVASRGVANNAREAVWIGGGSADVLIVVTLSRGPPALMTTGAANVPVLKATSDDAMAIAEIAYDQLQQARIDAGFIGIPGLPGVAPK